MTIQSSSVYFLEEALTKTSPLCYECQHTRASHYHHFIPFSQFSQRII